MYRRELSFVWTVLRRLGVDDDQVEDAAHDVFLVVHRKLAEFEGQCEARTWIYAIARRIAWRYRRGRRRRGRRRAALAAVPLDMETVATPPDEAVRRREADELLAAFLETLDRPKREAFVLGELQRMTRVALGEALGVSPTTAYSRLRAARADFDAAFGPQGPSATVVRQRARAAIAVPSRRRQRVWLALPVGLSGLGSSAMVTAVGLALVAIAWVHPVEDRRAISVRSSPVTWVHPRSSPPEVSSNESPPSPAPRASASAAVPEAPARVHRAQARSASARPKPGAAGALVASESSVVVDDHPADDDALDPLAQEALLLAEARSLMRAGRWRAAQNALESHRRRFPHGRLAVERRRSSITIACRRGDHQRAAAEVAALRSESPGSLSLTWIQEQCGPEGFDPREPRDETVVKSKRGGDQVDR